MAAPSAPAGSPRSPSDPSGLRPSTPDHEKGPEATCLGALPHVPGPILRSWSRRSGSPRRPGPRVAWATAGSSPTLPTLVVGGWWCSHLELDWQDASFRAFAERLATRFRVVRYDRPGTGLSDRDVPPPPDLDEEIAVLDAVVRAATADTSGRSGAGVLLLGVSSGSCVAVRYAATHPERVRRLVLYGSYADGHDLAPEAARRSLTSVVAAHWGLGSRVLADLFLPGAGPDERDAFARFQRLSASAEAAAASLASVYAMDVRGDLPEVTAPTLVVHRRDDHTIPAALGREVAAGVPGATFVPLDGVDHLPWRGNAASVVRAVSSSSSTARPSTRTAPAGRPRFVVRARGGGPAPRRSRPFRRRDRGSPGPQPAHRPPPRREHPHEARSHVPGGRRGGRGPRRSGVTVARVGHPPGWPVLAMRGHGRRPVHWRA